MRSSCARQDEQVRSILLRNHQASEAVSAPEVARAGIVKRVDEDWLPPNLRMMLYAACKQDNLQALCTLAASRPT